MDWQAFFLTMKLAFGTGIILLIVVIPLAWWMAHSHSWFNGATQLLSNLPLVLPPTVLGFYLLLLFSPQSLPGQWWQDMSGQSLVFSFSGLLLASCVYSLPFVLQPVLQCFRSINPHLLESAQILGAGRFRRWWAIILPLSRSALLSGFILGFAHTVGEFGLVLMIGGNIAGETKVLSIVLFEQVESLQFEQAHQTALLLLAIGVTVVSATMFLNRNKIPRY